MWRQACDKGLFTEWLVGEPDEPGVVPLDDAGRPIDGRHARVFRLEVRLDISGKLREFISSFNFYYSKFSDQKATGKQRKLSLFKRRYIF